MYVWRGKLGHLTCLILQVLFSRVAPWSKGVTHLMAYEKPFLSEAEAIEILYRSRRLGEVYRVLMAFS
jgi:hypothetical protein